MKGKRNKHKEQDREKKDYIRKEKQKERLLFTITAVNRAIGDYVYFYARSQYVFACLSVIKLLKADFRPFTAVSKPSTNEVN